MRVLFAISLFIFAACSGNQATNTEDIIGKTLNLWADSFQKQENLILTKTIYEGTKSEQKIDSNVNWRKEFEPLNKYSLKTIEESKDLLFDTVFDERTSRYLLRGMRLVPGDGFQNLFMVLDSTRQMIQFRIVDHNSSWFSKSQQELFWDAGGEYSFRSQKQSRFSKNEVNLLLGEW